MLLDVNNAYVSEYNHGVDAADFLDNIPGDRVRQIHLADHTLRAISKHYRITAEELAWLSERIEELGQVVLQICTERLTLLEENVKAD